MKLALAFILAMATTAQAGGPVIEAAPVERLTLAEKVAIGAIGLTILALVLGGTCNAPEPEGERC